MKLREYVRSRALFLFDALFAVERFRPLIAFPNCGREATMCGRYVRRGSKQKIAEYFQANPNPLELPMPDADYNVAPTTFQPIIRQSRETGDREMILARWGLVPFFTKALEEVKGLSTINARAESITKAPTWREPMKKRRCIIPANAFYEWVRPESRPDDCPARSRDRTCHPIGSTLRRSGGAVTLR